MELTDGQLQLIIDRLEEADKFISSTEADPMRQMQTNVLFQLGLQDEELMKQGFALLNKQLALMQKDMLNIVSSFRAGSIGFNDAVKDWRTMSGQHYKELFRAGGMAVGNPFYDKLGLTRPDVAYINRVRRSEERFFKKFLNDIKDPKHVPAKKIPRDARGRPLKGYRRQQFAYSDRAKMYANSAKTVFFGGQVAGSGPNTRIFWMLGPAERHCEVCPVYATNKGGQGYTWATLPTTPRSGQTPCLLSGRIGIYTDKGLKRVSRIAVGDLVLTHKGRYKKVIHTLKSPYKDEAITVTINVDGRTHRLVVTPDHSFMVDGKWKKANTFKSGD